MKEVKMKQPSLLNVQWAQLRWTCRFEQKAFGSERKILSTDPSPRLAALWQKIICCCWFKKEKKRSFFAFTHELEKRTSGLEGNIANREGHRHFQRASYKKANTKVNITQCKLSATHL